MPLYEYQCKSCEAVNEIHHKMADPAPQECPQCHGGPLEKLISQTAFVLKGKGWYADGYSGPSNKKDSASSDKAPEAAAAAPSGETSTKPAADTKPAPAKAESSPSPKSTDKK